METEEPGKSAMAKEIQVPEWEHIATKRGAENGGGDEKADRTPIGSTIAAKFDAMMPPHRRYLRMSRKMFILALSGLVLVLLALIIGLAVGLSHHRSQNLPLPTNTQSFTGDLTYFEPGLGACGETSTSADKIVAVSEILFDAAGSTSSNGGNSNANPLCNKMLRAQRYNMETGRTESVDLRVVDRCTGCAPDDLDTTESAFEQLAPIASGRVDVTWAWLQPVQTGS